MDKCKFVTDFSNLTEGQLVRIDNVSLSLENETELRTVKMFSNGSFKGMRLPEAGGLDINNLFNSLFKDYSYKLKGEIKNSDEKVLIKIPLTFESEFENLYNVDDLFIGNVSLIGIYKGKTKINGLKNSFEFFQELGQVSNSDSDSEVHNSQYTVPTVFKLKSENDGVDGRSPGILGEGREDRRILLYGLDTREFACEGVDHVLHRPSRYDQIESHDEQRGNDAVVSQCSPVSGEHAVGSDCIAVCVAADGELGKHDRYSDEQNAEDIDQQECRTSVFACDIGKSPDIAQTDGTAGCNEYGAQLAAERCPMSCFHHLVLFCLTENRNRFSAVLPAASGRLPCLPCGSCPAFVPFVSRPPVRFCPFASRFPCGFLPGRMSFSPEQICLPDYFSSVTATRATLPPSGGASLATVQRMCRIRGYRSYNASMMFIATRSTVRCVTAIVSRTVS